MAPEIYGYPNGGGYNERVDIWSIGCVVLQMITGKKNFWPEPECEQLFIDYQMPFNPKAPGFNRNTLSPELCDFLDCCFKIKQEDRLSANELLEHNYLKAFKNNHC
jgi:mitogen-activated protein kinase kinase kinase